MPIPRGSLPTELERTASAIRHAALPDAQHRLLALFLRTEEYALTGYASGELLADLMLETLPRFVASKGGHIVSAISLREGAARVAGWKHVAVDGLQRPILNNGMLFIDLGAQRIVLGVKRLHFGGGENTCEMKLAGTDEAAVLLREWEAYARGDNYLRGRAFFADGVLLGRKRRYTWDDIVLPQAALDTVRLHVEQFLRNRSRLRKLGVKPRRGLILAGPPGTGKTLLSKILADQVQGSSFAWVMPRHVRSPWSLDSILEVARFVAPTCLFMEDLDLYAEERESDKSMALGELMNQLDGVAENEDIITIATTNRLHVVERAVRNRPGRFDRVIRVGLPNEASRHKLLNRLLEKVNVSAADLEMLARDTWDWSCAQLEELTNTIKFLALESANSEGQLQAHRGLLERALSDVCVERRKPIGFN